MASNLYLQVRSQFRSLRTLKNYRVVVCAGRGIWIEGGKSSSHKDSAEVTDNINVSSLPSGKFGTLWVVIVFLGRNEAREQMQPRI